jgi:hypothetical protein
MSRKNLNMELDWILDNFGRFLLMFLGVIHCKYVRECWLILRDATWTMKGFLSDGLYTYMHVDKADTEWPLSNLDVMGIW